ncbi:MAG: hypothetical protein ACRD44_06300, partial [Bryobacteraceae bacterium]
MLRQLVERLEAEASQQNLGRNGSGTGGGQADGETSLSELRGRLLQQAARVSGATRRTLADVINEAAKGEF